MIDGDLDGLIGLFVGLDVGGLYEGCTGPVSVYEAQSFTPHMLDP